MSSPQNEHKSPMVTYGANNLLPNYIDPMNSWQTRQAEWNWERTQANTIDANRTAMTDLTRQFNGGVDPAFFEGLNKQYGIDMASERAKVYSAIAKTNFQSAEKALGIAAATQKEKPPEQKKSSKFGMGTLAGVGMGVVGGAVIGGVPGAIAGGVMAGGAAASQSAG
jgi:hypothetical protein